MKVIVLMGGDSDERDVSLASGAQVAAALREAGHEVSAVDTVHGALTAEQEQRLVAGGVGVVPPADLVSSSSPLPAEVRLEDGAVVFPALHGGAGEDGTLQAFLSLAGATFAGSDMLGCALSMDKDVSKRLMRDAGIATPDWVVAPDSAETALACLELPVIVKPVSGGSSVYLSLCRTADELDRALTEAPVGVPMMVEQAVTGREFTVGILGDEAFPVGEIVSEHELFDYECKYQPGMAQEIFPADVEPEKARLMESLALDVHRLLRLRDFSRVDFILDEDGVPWCLEANALPGLTANSLLPKAARAGGLSFPELCDRIVRMALARRE